MSQNSPDFELFKQQLRTLFNQATRDSQTKNFHKNQSIYTCGDKSESVYFIESGKIKLSTISLAGKECLLSIYSSGDIFGESGLSKSNIYQETAIAMEKTVIKQIHYLKFFILLQKDYLLEGFVKYLVERIAEQQEIITDLVTIDSEKRLGKTLLRLAQKMGKPTPSSIMITHRLSQEELSAMVGTTRPRISEFMRRFRENNLIEISSNHFILVKEKNLIDYLETMT
jgi:CRP/FNR family transcriptional regulator, cyclic AMP receptor protein